MTRNSGIVDGLQTALTLGSSRVALAGAAIFCACGLGTAGVLIAHGTISLDQFRQSIATIGTVTTESSQVSATDALDSQAAAPDMSATPETVETPRIPPAMVAAPPTFDIVRVEPDGNAVLAGLSAPNDRIEVMSGDQLLARAKANSAGEWALVLDEPLQPGGHQISVHSLSSQSDEPLVSVQNVTVAVPENATESAIVMLDQPGQPSAIWQSPAKTIRPDIQAETEPLPDLAPTDATGMSRSSTPVADDAVEGSAAVPDPAIDPEQTDLLPEAPLVTIEAIETEGEAELLVSGASRPNASVRLFLDNSLIGETVAGPVGRWHLQTTRAVPRGKLMLRAEQLEHAGGAVLARREVPFERDPEIIGSLAASFDPDTTIDDEIRTDTASGSKNVEISGKMIQPTQVVVGRGDNLWTIARRIYGSGVRYTTLYSANKDQIRDPASVFPDQVLVVPVQDTATN